MPFHKKVKKFAVKHGKKVGSAALTAVKETAATFGPGKKIKVVRKVASAVVTGVKIAKPKVVKGLKVAENVAHKALTSKVTKKSVKTFEKVMKKGLNVATGTIMVGGMIPLLPISLGIMGAKAGTKLAIKHGGKAVKSLKAKLKNIWSNPK
jgi:hypothetical protein